MTHLSKPKDIGRDESRPCRLKPAPLLLAILAAVALTAAEHKGQVQFGGLPVPGASVTVTQGDKKIAAVTDSKGIYTFKDLPDGNWKLHVDMLCFSPIDSDIIVAPDAPAAVWELKLMPFAEIQAAAGPPPPKSADTPKPITLSTDLPPKPEPPAAPKKGKNAKAAALATPTDTKSGFQRANVNASAGSSGLANETPEPNQNANDGFLVNGSVNNGAASPFAQSGAFGNNRRNGRSLYNGGVGITMDNAALDARTFSFTGQDTAKPGYNHIQGFASFGGPLLIPHVLKPTQYPINFFVGYQWQRNRTANTLPGLMPTPDERLGDFSKALNPLGQPVTIYDGAAPFPGNVIPANRISQQAAYLLKNLYPQPNFASSNRYNYQIPSVGSNNSDGVQANLNKTFNTKNQMFGSFGYQRTSGINPNIFGFTDTSNTSGLLSSIGYSRRFTTHLFARFNVQYSRFSSRSTPYFANRENVSKDAGIFGNNQDPLNWGPPALSFTSGITGLSDGNQSLDRNQTTAFSYSSYWNRRSHNVQFGADYKKLQFNALSQQNPRGRFTFTGAATTAPASLGLPGTGSDFADFLLGVPDASAIAFGNADKYFRSSSYDAFIVDDWRVNSGLTLNVGVRWEYNSPITEKYGRLVSLDIAPGYADAVPVEAFSPVGALTGQHYSDSLVNPDKHAIQPRLGIAWRPLPASSLIVRAGYGVYYNTSVYQSIATQMSQQYPLSTAFSVQNSPQNPLTLANGFISSPLTTPTTFAVDPNMRVGYAQNWNVIVQRDLPFALVMTATYIGIKGTREQQEFLPNTYPVGAGNPCPTCLAGYTYLTSNGNSTRESAQLQLRRRLHNGFTASLNYTFSKSIDDASLSGTPASSSTSGNAGNTAQRVAGNAVIAQNWLDLDGERGLSAFDQRHLLSVQGQYTTGMGVKGGTLLSGWKGRLYKEWTISTILSAGSGLPESPQYVAPVQGTGVFGPLRPEYTGASVTSAPSGFFLNPAAYIAPLPGQFGNAARNSIIGPSQFSLNASMARTFRLNDRFNADLSLQATNVLNHVNFSSWNTNINNAQFGLPAAANGMRRVQASLRVRF
jgi:hypothetical protein